MKKSISLSAEERAARAPETVCSRRGFLKFAAGGLAVCAAPGLVRPDSARAAASEAGKTLIVYFSHSGNTRQLAGQIHERVGGDMAELKTVEPYPGDYNACVERAKQEQRSGARPRLATEIPDLGAYDVVFLGYPNWWGTMPMPLFTFLEQHSLAGKTVVPFCTHGGSRLGRSESDIRKLCPQAHLLPGFEAYGSRVSEAEVDAWLRSLGLPSR